MVLFWGVSWLEGLPLFNGGDLGGGFLRVEKREEPIAFYLSRYELGKTLLSLFEGRVGFNLFQPVFGVAKLGKEREREGEGRSLWV